MNLNNYKMDTKERQSRIIARGEHSNHSHIITGDGVTVKNGIVEIPDNVSAQIKHLFETDWLAGGEKWTGEHTDIDLDNKGDVRHGDVYLKKIGDWKYKYIAQEEYDPFEKIIRRVVD